METTISCTKTTKTTTTTTITNQFCMVQISMELQDAKIRNSEMFNNLLDKLHDSNVHTCNSEIESEEGL